MIRSGDCVRIPDGRVGRVREKTGNKWRVRVRRMTSETDQFLLFTTDQVQLIQCPRGWMSPDGYNRYLEATLTKLRRRMRESRRRS